MKKTGWDPPALMQDDNAQLSQWFATRPDARYVFISNQRRDKHETTNTDTDCLPQVVQGNLP